MEADVGCTTGKFFVGVKMEGASSVMFDVLLRVILLLGLFLLGATLLCTRQAHFPRRQHKYAQTNVVSDESPTALSSAIGLLPAVATATLSKDSLVPPLEAPSMVKGQPQTIINGSVRSLNLTINNNALPQSDQATLMSMVEVLQALRADINKIGRQVSRSRQKTAQGPPFQQNPGPGPWASSNFDHYEYGSESGDDSGWGTDRRWPDFANQLTQEADNDEHAEEGEAFETQTTIQDRADCCNVEAIDLWRSGTEEGAAVDKENQGNQPTVAPASGSSRTSRKSQRQQPSPPIAHPNPTDHIPTPRSVQATPSTTLDFTPSPVLSNVLSGVISGDPSTLDGALDPEWNSKAPLNCSLQCESEEVERQSIERGSSSHGQLQEGRRSLGSIYIKKLITLMRPQ